MQQLFGVNSGTDLLSTKLKGNDVTGQGGLFASSVWDAEANEVIIKVVNNNKEIKSTTLELNSVKRFLSKAEMTVLASTDLDVVNTLANPNNIVPETKEIKVSGKQIKLDLDPYSFSVIRVKQK